MVECIDRAGVEVNVGAPDTDDKASPVDDFSVKLPDESRPSIVRLPTKLALLTLGDIL